MKIKINDNQSPFDVAVQHGGSVEAAFQWAIENNLSVTDELQKGEEYSSPEVTVKKVQQEFSAKNWIPATMATTDDEGGELLLEGIGYWAIGTDFIVN